MVVSIRYHAKLTGNGRFRSSRADFEQSQSREGERRRGAVSTEEGRKKMREKKRTWISSRAVGFIAWSPRVARSIARGRFLLPVGMTNPLRERYHEDKQAKKNA
ncbi:hypothetical protein BHE74_00047289 [Ensete ventricosum]|nr:hypothetical protein BHE74_00047289 [Ensete ventricosum]